MSPPFLHLLLLLLSLLRLSATASPQQQPPFPNPCGERCGHLPIPFPFHLNSSCGPRIDAFRLSCPGDGNSSSPFLALGGLRVIDFLPTGSLLLDYSPNSSSSSSCDRWYSDVSRSFPFDRSPFFAVTARNVIRLYDCEDSSICRQGCETIGSGGCEGSSGGRGYLGCCYPLSDGSVWKAGDGFGVFSEFGCRGFSSWAVVRAGDGVAAEPGIEIEWAVPRGYGDAAACAEGAISVNATAVVGGVRCACQAGLDGDGFEKGVGCLQSCSNDGPTTYSSDCCKGRLSKKKVAVLSGVLVSAFFLAAATASYFLLRRPVNANRWDLDPACLPKILGKSCSSRLFTYQELSEATKKFEDEPMVVDIVDGSTHTGILDDGTLVAIQEVRCETQHNLRQALERVELLSRISHRNIARTVGFCVGSTYSMLLVHEFFSTGTLEELLQRSRGNGLSWYHRVNIATEIASALVYLQCDISPPIYLHELTCGDVFIDSDYTVKIACFKILNSVLGVGSCSYVVSQDSRVVANFGIILLDLIVGSSRHEQLPELLLPKIKERKFREIVDPYLGFNEQLPVQCEQIEKVACFAAQCLSSSGNGDLRMVDVVKEFIHIVGDSISSSSRIEPALEVTFSNSSLLQMISMSPDSIHVP